MTRLSRFAALALAMTVAASPVQAASPAETAPAVTPNGILAAAPPTAWRAVDPDDLIVMDLAGGGRVILQLAAGFAPAHVANIKALVRAHRYDGVSIERVQDNYVVQWGDPSDRPLPPGVQATPPAEYERAAASLKLDLTLPYRDTFADHVGFAQGWPVAETGDQAWLVHCYGMVGVGRDLTPDTGSGVELYTVIGQAPRALDRNIAVVGRVLAGMDQLTALPRGKGDLGFYIAPQQGRVITQVRMAADMPVAERPRYGLLATDSPTFQAWVKARANRQDTFFLRPAGAVDLCNALPPVRDLSGQ